MCTLRKFLSVPHQMLQKHPSRQYPTQHVCTSGAMWAQRPLTRTICHLILFPSASCLVVKQNILLVQRQMSVTDGNLDNFRKVLKGYIDATSAHSDNLQWVCCVFSGNARYLCKHCQSLLLGSRFDHRGNVESAVWIFQLCQSWCQ